MLPRMTIIPKPSVSCTRMIASALSRREFSCINLVLQKPKADGRHRRFSALISPSSAAEVLRQTGAAAARTSQHVSYPDSAGHHIDFRPYSSRGFRCFSSSTDPDDGEDDEDSDLVEHEQFEHRHSGICMNPDSISKGILPGNVVMRTLRSGKQKPRYTELVYGYFWMLKVRIILALSFKSFLHKELTSCALISLDDLVAILVLPLDWSSGFEEIK